MSPFILFIFQLLVLLFSVVIHEVSHGLIAYRLGDPTAKFQGRLTLNPIAHLDLWGSVIIPLVLFFASGGSFLFGWAKPVPYNPYNLINQKWGPAAVGFAGPASNLILALSFGLFLRFLPLSSPILLTLAQLISIIVILNLLLAIFNLVPIPPLDGSKLLYAFLPERYDNLKILLERYGLIFLVFFILFLFPIVAKLTFLAYRFIVGRAILF